MYTIIQYHKDITMYTPFQNDIRFIYISWFGSIFLHIKLGYYLPSSENECTWLNIKYTF